ncbi:MAG: Fe-S-containing protein [Nitrospirota bacterium]|nr:Fe-S-containing protein [Nitrospirota bacterium]
MQCPKCSTENSAESQFCKKCGNSLTGVSSKRDKVMAEESSSSNKFVVLGVVLAVAVAAAIFLFKGAHKGATNTAVSASSFVQVTAENGLVKIPIEKINDGQAHYFTLAEGGKSINFFVLKSQDGTIRAAFDTCDVCYSHKKGYRQEGSEMVCNQCDQRFPADKINDVKGGCNPAPLNRTVEGNMLVISQADIVSGAGYF